MPARRKGRYSAIHAPRRLNRILALVVLTTAAATLAPTLAYADGDPASDYLLTQPIFFPYDAKFPATQQAAFAGLVRAANRSGFKIRVALIATNYDMGSVTSLFRKPRMYARFLGSELEFVYRQRLLVVMPNGLGFNWPKHSSAPAYAVLDKIHVPAGSSGLLVAAQTAVQRLAAASGVHVSPAAHVRTTSGRNSHDRLIIIIAVLAALLLAFGTRYALRLRRR